MDNQDFESSTTALNLAMDVGRAASEVLRGAFSFFHSRWHRARMGGHRRG